MENNSSITIELWGGWGDAKVHIFLQGIIPIMNVIARLDYELTELEATFQHFSFYDKGTTTGKRLEKIKTERKEANEICFLWWKTARMIV